MFRTILSSLGLALFAMFAGAVAEAAPRGVNSCTTISNPGSYIMTRSINATAQVGDCIIIDSSYVTLEMNGHVIAGPGFVGGIISGHGIFVNGTTTNVEVRNGAITGFTSGVVFDVGSRAAVVEKIRATENEGVGVYVRSVGSRIIGNITTDNGTDGINFAGGGGGALVRDNVTHSNGENGIEGNCDGGLATTLVIANVAFDNAIADINVSNTGSSPTCVIIDNAG
jgi:hypothetical protein